MAQNDKSVSINLPKARKFTITSISPGKRAKNVLTKIRYPELTYITKRNPYNYKIIKNDKSFLSYRTFVKLQQKGKYKTNISLNVKKVNEDDIITIMQTDKKFYKTVDGRPLFHNVPKFKSLKVVLNDLLKLRIEIGFKRDCVLNMDIQSRKEINKYNKGVEHCAEQARYFTAFISEDYKKSTALLQKSNNLHSKVDAVLMDLQNLATKQCTLTSNIIGLYYKYKMQQKYGRFLYYLSPPTWRAENRNFARSIEIETMGFDLGESKDNDIFSVIFENVKSEITEPIVQPALYFQQPKDMLNVFSQIEQHYAHDFNQLMHLTGLTTNLQVGINALRKSVTCDSIVVNNTIGKFQKRLKSLETQCDFLEKRFYEELYGAFYEDVGSPEVLRFILHLNFCYERLTGAKSENRDIMYLASYLEKFYMTYSKKLDAVKSKSIRVAMGECEKADQRKVRRGLLATRELRRATRLESSLARAMAPPPTNRPRIRYVPSVRRYTRTESTKSKSVVSPRASLTSDQELYLYLFTEWTRNEDPTPYLSSFHDQF